MFFLAFFVYSEYLCRIKSEITMATHNDETTFRPLSKERGVSDLAYDNFPVGVVICDTKGRIILMNRRNCDIFGIVDAQKVYGYCIFDDEDILPTHRAQMKIQDDYTYSYVLDTEHLTARGKSTFTGKRQLFCRFRKVFDEQQNHRGYILVNVDLTSTQLEPSPTRQTIMKSFLVSRTQALVCQRMTTSLNFLPREISLRLAWDLAFLCVVRLSICLEAA